MQYKTIKQYKYEFLMDLSFTGYFDYPENITTTYVTYNAKTKQLILKKGFRFNGADDPAIDSETIMIPAAAHDALCELMELNIIDDSYSKEIDRAYRSLCVVYGQYEGRNIFLKLFSQFRTWYHYTGIRGLRKPFNKYMRREIGEVHEIQVRHKT